MSRRREGVGRILRDCHELWEGMLAIAWEDRDWHREHSSSAALVHFGCQAPSAIGLPTLIGLAKCFQRLLHGDIIHT